MKRFILLATIATFLICQTGFSQVKMGVKAGLSFTNWDGQAVNSLEKLVSVTNGMAQMKMKTGFYAGAFADLPLGERFSLEPGLYYTQKGYTLSGNLEIDKLNFLGANVSAQVRSHYIDMPLLFKANITKGLNIYAGPQVSYMVMNDLRLSAGILGINFLHQSIPMTDLFKRWDAAIVGGVGYQFENGLSLNAGYDYGLTKIDKGSNFSSYNRVIRVGIGYRF